MFVSSTLRPIAKALLLNVAVIAGTIRKIFVPLRMKFEELQSLNEESLPLISGRAAHSANPFQLPYLSILVAIHLAA